MELTYTIKNGFPVPNLEQDDQPVESIGKYGLLRRAFLREHAPMLYEEMIMLGTLAPHLEEMDKTIRSMVLQTMTSLLDQTELPNRNSDPLGWSQAMNALKMQAEELAAPTLYAL